jgi:DOPA 4,5-dioxygenase
MNTNLPFLPGKNPFDIHVYFKPDEAALAKTLKTRLVARFGWLEEGRWNDSASPLSPHPLPMFELFGVEIKNISKVSEVIEWLNGNRGGLSVLIHPNTTDGNAQDHSVHAVWLGRPLAVRIWIFHAQTVIKAALMLASVAVIGNYARSRL